MSCDRGEENNNETEEYIFPTNKMKFEFLNCVGDEITKEEMCTHTIKIFLESISFCLFIY